MPDKSKWPYLIFCLLVSTFLTSFNSTFAPDSRTPVSTDSSMEKGSIIAYLHLEKTVNSLNTIDIDTGLNKKISPDGEEVSNFSWSPDGQQFVYQIDKGNDTEVYSMPWTGSDEPLMLLDDSYYAQNPVWSPDGKKVAFFTRKLGHWALFTMDADGSNPVDITENTVYESTPSWSPDSKSIAFNPWHNTQSPPYIAVVDVDGSNMKDRSV